MEIEMQKIILTGSTRWDDKLKIKNCIFSLKTKFNEELHIISGGMHVGADAMIKKNCLEFNIKFSEIPPYNFPYTPYYEHSSRTP